MLLLFLVCSTTVASEFNWTGQWDSIWRHRGARITLEQTGQQVTGGYDLYGGEIDGVVSGLQLTGTWKEGGRSGPFLAIMSSDGRTFTARFGNNEWLTAIRVEDDNAYQGDAFDYSSPASVLFHFLSIMNAVGPGRMELQSEASHFIDFSRPFETRISELDYTRLLFEVLDRLTFRSFDIKHSATDRTASVRLYQAGSDVSLLLEFTRTGDEWHIDPPSPDLLRETLEALKAARPALRPGVVSELRSPRDTLRTLVESFDKTDGASLERAVRTLNLQGLSALAREYEAPRLARYINRVIERLGPVIWQEVPDDPAATSPYVYFEHPLGVIAIEPVLNEAGQVEWLFGQETLASIRSVYAALDNLPSPQALYQPSQPVSLYFKIRDYVRSLNTGLVRQTGPMETWQWIGLLVTFVLAYILGRLLSRLIVLLALRYASHEFESPAFLEWLLRWSFTLLSVGLGLRLADYALSFPDVVQVLIATISWSTIILSVTAMLLLVVKLMADHVRRKKALMGHNITLVSLVSGIIRVAIVLTAILMLADVLQVPYQSVLAGLGIGGIAVALAAQSTLQNFISGITLYFDKPIAIGDFCRFGEQMGTVEFIGMRSTRIRTLDRTLVTIPNSEFSNMQIENYAKRDQMFLNSTLRLRYETAPDQLRYVLVQLREMLLAHPKVASDPLRVRLIGFGEHSLDLEIFAYLMTTDRAEFVAIREDIYLRVMDIVTQAGTKFAFPAVVHYNTTDRMPDPAQSEASVNTVAQWREEGRLPFPDHPWPDKAQLRSTLDYPPRGSSTDQTDPFGQERKL
ncbi:hypothetical protein DBV39_00345 [Orrella marina]|uniref:Mechanosensitive ion channel family protein n=1 Tax=Orrella marina TaxID=2163011 RepID=A0A2R4XF41_9BURK|nr:hypothetical protein DBV39_00345 [Orrella marina]